jgi:hypothetical protein
LVASVVVFLGIVDFSFERVGGWIGGERGFARNRLVYIQWRHISQNGYNST